MPPKGSRRGKKKKEQEVPLVHREPPDLDELEAAMLWDHVGAIEPNPLSVDGAQYSYATTQAFDSGASHPLVVDHLSATSPLLGTASLQSLLQAQAALTPAPPNPNNNNNNNNVSMSSAAPQGVQGSSVSVSQSYALVQGSAFAPRPPPRHVTNMQRSNYRLHACEQDMKHAIRNVRDTLESHRGFWLMMATEHFENLCEVKQLTNDVCVLEVMLYFNELRHDGALDMQLHSFNTQKFRLEARMEDQLAILEDVQAQLAEKHDTLRKRRDMEDALFEAQRAHATRIKNMSKELAGDRNRLEDNMNQKLLRTSEEMAKVTAAQREERQKRAQEESNRLVSELSVLERRSKYLNDRSLKLQHQSDSTRRDRELEQHRRQLLIQKNHVVGEQVKKVVSELQALEHQVAETQLASAAGQKAAHEQAMDRVDQQYESIAYLRTELESVRADTESVRAKIRDAQKQLLAHAGGKHLPITLPNRRSGDGSSVTSFPVPLAIEQRSSLKDKSATLTAKAQEALLSLDSNTATAIRAVVLEAIRDTNDAMRAMPVKGCHTVYDLPDPQEQLLVQQYVARRVSKLLSCVYPSAPPFSFLRAAAQNPSSLARSL